MKSTIARILVCLFLVTACILPLFASCGNTAYRSDIPSAAVMDAVTAAVPAQDGYTPAGEGYINASMWGEDYQTLLDSLTDYRILISGNSAMNVDELGIFRVKDGGDLKAVTAIVKEFTEAQKLRYKDLLASYNPSELPKLDQTRVTVCGPYIFYTIFADDATDKAHNAFCEAVKIHE